MKLAVNKRVIFVAIPLVIIILVSAGAYFFFTHRQVDKSSVSVSTSDSSISAKFQITPQDQGLQSQFSNDLGISSDWSQGLSVALSSATIDLVKSSLPQKLFLTFGQKDLKFQSSVISPIASSLVGKDYDFATGSASLHLKAFNSSTYSLQMNNPSDLLNYATASGTLYVSPVISQLYPIIGKIATIKIDSSNGFMEGEILLK